MRIEADMTLRGRNARLKRAGWKPKQAPKAEKKKSTTKKDKK